MSSHHFVIEGQEPSLIIADPDNFTPIQSLLEWSPEVLVLQDALDKVLLSGIKADVVVCLDSQVEEVKEQTRHQTPIKILSCLLSIDLLKTALNYLAVRKQKSVNISYRQPDDLFPELQAFPGIMEISVYSANEKWSLARTGTFRKWLPAQSHIKIKSASLWEVTEGNIKLTDSGLQVLSDSFVAVKSGESMWISEQI